jgi:hypothetical protein
LSAPWLSLSRRTTRSADITALVADRIVREILTGLALRRR